MNRIACRVSWQTLAALVAAVVSSGLPSARGASLSDLIASDQFNGAAILAWQLAAGEGGIAGNADPPIAAATLPANSVVASLDLFYANPLDTSSGGVWKFIAIASDQGVAGLVTQLRGIAAIPTFAAPQPAFKEFFGPKPFYTDTDNNPATLEMLFGQVPVSAPGPQDLLYRAGVMGGSTPYVDPLRLLHPLAFDMTDGVVLATGVFAPGASPNIVPNQTSANVFTAQGTATNPPPAGSIQPATVTVQLRTNAGVPEPASTGLATLACAALAGVYRRRVRA